MATFDASALTLTRENVTSLNEAIAEKTYALPSLNEYHTIYDNIVQNKQIAFLSMLNGMVGKKVDLDAAQCYPDTNTCKIVGTQKEWIPINIWDRITECWKTLEPTFIKYMLNKGVAKPDITATVWGNFIAERYSYAIQEFLLRATWFGDEDAAAYTSSPGGTFYNNGNSCVTVDNFNYYDGLWKQIFAAVTAGTITAKYDISENSEATYAAQSALATTKALDVFRNLYELADPRIWSAGANPVFEVTKSLFDNWVALMEDKSLVFTLDRTEQGATKWSYRGIPIVIRYDWDRNIRANEDNATTWNKPHRAILTTKGNIPIGTSDEASMKNFDSFYDKVTKLWYVDVAFYLDVKVLEESMIAVAF